MNQIKGTQVDTAAGSITDQELAIHLEDCLRSSDPGVLTGALAHIARFSDLLSAHALPVSSAQACIDFAHYMRPRVFLMLSR